MEMSTDAEVDLSEAGRAETFNKHLMRAVQAANEGGVPFPLHITIHDSQGVSALFRADAKGTPLCLLTAINQSRPLQYPVQAFISRSRYPEELAHNEVFLHYVIELSEADGGRDWMHSTYSTRAPSAYRDRDEFLKEVGALGWIGRQAGAQKDIGVVAFYQADIHRAIEMQADILVETRPGGPAYVYEAKPCQDKQTLRIGPVSPEELHQLMAFIRALTPESDKRTLTKDEFRLYAQRRSTGRNEPCPCGSGKKFKKCCGMMH